jgi:PAS domain S-box-containing protein
MVGKTGPGWRRKAPAYGHRDSYGEPESNAAVRGLFLNKRKWEDVHVKKQTAYLPFFFLIILCTCLFTSCLREKENKPQPLAKKGVLDLRQWNFNDNGTVKLAGEWEFYWQTLASPDQLNNNDLTVEYITVPKPWNNTVINGQSIPGSGFATYRLKVIAGEKQIGLKVLDISSSSQIFANGDLIYSAGSPGTTREESIPSYTPSVITVNNITDRLDIVVHVSNFHHYKGGLWEPLTIGKVSHLSAEREKELGKSSLFFGAIWIIGFYHLILFLIRQKDTSSLLFGITCLLQGFQSILLGERYIMTAFPEMKFWLFIKLIYLTMYSSVPMFIWYMRSIFPDEMSGNLVKSILLIGSLFCAYVLFLPSHWFTMSLTLFRIFTLCLILYGTITLYKAILNKRQGAMVFLTGFVVLVSTVVHDIFITSTLIPFGLSAFLFSQAFLIAQRYSLAFSTIEQQGEVLAIENQQRKIAEHHLQKSRKKYRDMVELLPIPVSEYDLDLNTLYANKAARDWFGYTEAEFNSGINISHLTENGSLKTILSQIKYQKTGQPLKSIALKLKRKDGSTLWGQATFAVISKDDKPFAFRTCFVDLSEQKKAEKAQLYAAEQKKLALVGQVAGKIAHDFNNILAAIMGNTEIALTDCQDPNMEKTLKLLLEQSERGATLTRNLVAFSKDQEIKEDFFNVNEKVELVLNLLKKELQNIELTKELYSDLPRLLADPGMIEHALVNIIQNAVHATSTTLRPEITIKTYESDCNILIEIRDNGCGIPHQHRKDIYDPAFTLKGEQDKTGSYDSRIMGTGYGMSNVKKYMDLNKGTISFTSQLDKGTTFILSFPVTEKKLTAKEKAFFSAKPIVTRQKILLVEDEKTIASIQSDILTRSPFYHSTVLAPDGRKAMELFDSQSFDLVSLDYMLKGVDTGLDVYRHIRNADKQIPVIFVSGNMKFLKSVEELKSSDPFVEHLSKPHRNLVYLNTVNGLLLKAGKRLAPSHPIKSTA